MQPLVASLIQNAVADPQRLAFVYQNQGISYGEVLGRLVATTKKLRGVGVGASDRVLICGPNSPSVAIAYFAVHAVGAIAAPIAPGTVEENVHFIVEDCGVRVALMGHNRFRPPCRTFDLDEFVNSESNGLEFDIACKLDDTADILYTTGTTGRKKGVVLSQGNIAAVATNINAFIQNGRDDVEVVPIPLSHSFGLGRLRCAAQTGGALILEEGLTFPVRVLKTMLDRRATGFCSVPAGFELILKATGDMLEKARDHLRCIEIGSAPMQPETKRRLMTLLPHTRICHHYGLTEASRAAFIEYHADATHLESIGKPSPNVEIQIWDEHDQPLPNGQLGEIVVRSQTTMRQYWGQPELTKQAYSNGWLHTSDLGYYDKDGYLYLVARKSDIINVGGRKVAPMEVERVLDRYPGIVESACKGIPDPHGITGEAVKAFIVSDGQPTDLADLVQWLRDYLEDWQVPSEFEFVEAIPKTASGKLQRHLLGQ
jgi:long-chain acyl-CoA synthetase